MEQTTIEQAEKENNFIISDKMGGHKNVIFGNQNAEWLEFKSHINDSELWYWESPKTYYTPQSYTYNSGYAIKNSTTITKVFYKNGFSYGTDEKRIITDDKFEYLDKFLNDPFAPKLVDIGNINFIILAKKIPPPEFAIKNCIQGEVVVEIWLSEKGIPTKCISIWGHESLKITAESTFKNIQCDPYIINGKPMPIRFRTIYSCTLNCPGDFYKAPTWFYRHP